MENGPFIDDFPIKTSIYKWFSMAMLNNQMVYPPETIDSPSEESTSPRISSSEVLCPQGRWCDWWKDPCETTGAARCLEKNQQTPAVFQGFPRVFGCFIPKKDQKNVFCFFSPRFPKLTFCVWSCLVKWYASAELEDRRSAARLRQIFQVDDLPKWRTLRTKRHYPDAPCTEYLPTFGSFLG